ncbi:hypothetical protein JX265_006333 [Neoarthrinium moseri]|uniref:Uncharacterized protein n=1 Tax=Neoarthrinium moseri TaxID=1658444 RepID=A0A9P9WLW5_9PEZI|nr:uncharacterized protein JN550_008277 [Neoarthrinium moseri]KAI1852283.1 hypothetical protein JX266_002461 [Neoarthrinium moseri]KAI1865520.1 hypothetical protein JN550_008277 [Neoarthrinium moseri]KAI1870163.1 hypothetical protein JX265_006333 [Neoarthrinium moseri]
MQLKSFIFVLFAAGGVSALNINKARQNNNNGNGCNANQNNNNNQNGNQNNQNGNQNNNQNGNQNNNNQNGNQNGGANAGADVGAADFGQCDPSIDFQLGRAGRKADEGTFLPVDPLVAQGQQDALNPNIITNRVCDQLTNVCNANAAAVALCEDAQAQVAALGTKDASTADAFNAALGF